MPQKSCQQRNSASRLMKERVGQLKRQQGAGCQSPNFLLMARFSILISEFQIFKEFSKYHLVLMQETRNL